MIKTSTRKRFARTAGGYTLLEVLVGISVFALGMLALAQLQTSLTRNSSDSNSRTVAVNIAEETIERARTFSQITSNGGVNAAYNDIVDATTSETRFGVTYTVAVDVTDYYWANNAFTTAAPLGAAKSDFKLVDVDVSWSSPGFQVDNGSDNTADLGSGSIELSDVISSVTSGAGGRATLGMNETGGYSPPVDYNPGQNPDIIPIHLGANKFKESTTPLPDVIRTDELVETRFDVVTYSQDDEGATFLRREEFRALSCECTLRIPDAEGEGGLRPTVWDGNEYEEGQFVSKPYGEEANNQQSQFCGICCRDHHDGGSGSEDDPDDPGRTRYSPFFNSVSYYDSSNGALQGDHKHYRLNNLGNLVLATNDGDTYLEACRLVRKDGFWRVAQDLRQEGLNAFPGDYLDEDDEIAEYSGYVTGAVLNYEDNTNPANDQHPTNPYEDAPPALATPALINADLAFPASSYALATQMQVGGTVEQQLRSRGIYIDYMSDTVRERINCLQLGYTPESCEVPNVTTALEIIPFYDVQLTWLSRWNETPNNYPIDVTNEAIADDNTHSRGVATLEAGYGYSTINVSVHGRNLGLTGTDPIDPWFGAQTRNYNLFALAVDPDSPPGFSTIKISGSITSAVGGVKAADVEIDYTGASCDRTLTGYECVIWLGSTNPRIEVFNYAKTGKTLVACSTYLNRVGSETVQANGRNWARFELPTDASTSVANIVIRENSCG